MEWVAILFMFFAGANFALLYRAATGRPRDLLRDAELRTYAAILLAASGVLTLLLVDSYPPLDAVRHSLFQVASILTSTGFASADFALWSLPAQMVLVVLMFVGGCAGSASGGVKVVRWIVIAKSTARELIRALHPRAVLPVRVGARTVSEEVVRAVAAFLTLYIGLFAVTTLILVVLGADFVVAFTAAISCLGNVGPGLESIGPMASFADLHPISRGVLTFVMYAGRLEVVTVFVIFTPGWWRPPHRRASTPWRDRSHDEAASMVRKAAS
jgi:trk system potassium uptake protein TrkH